MGDDKSFGRLGALEGIEKGNAGSPEGGRPRVLRRNDRLGSQGVLSGFSWVLMGSQWVLMGSHGFSWGSQWVLRLCIFGFSGVSQAGTPPLRVSRL